MRVFRGHLDFVLRVAFSPDGCWLASGGADNTVRLWDLLRGVEVPPVHEARGWVSAVAFSPDGRWLAIGEHHGRLTLTNRETGVSIPSTVTPPSVVARVAFTPDARGLVWCGFDGGAHYWNLDPDATLVQQDLVQEPRELTAIAVSSEGRYLAVSGRTGRVLVWRLPDLRQRMSLSFDDLEGCRGLAFDSRERMVLAALPSGVSAWELPEGRHLWHVEHPSVVSAVVVSFDGDVLVTGSWDGRIRMFALDLDVRRPPRLVRTFDFGQSRIFDLALSRDGMLGASAGTMPDPLILWDLD